ncbi:MAG: BrnT family toxin [Erysipelotrichaceae bacterium]|nr:BrnT family toxin [Erysipelotrichaceae bacterium]
MEFEWDPRKNRENRKKHKVSFEEAVTVFLDDESVIFDDPDHSEKEERFLIVGTSSKTRLLIVCHCYRLDDSVIRIISARRTTTQEERDYLEIKRGW